MLMVRLSDDKGRRATISLQHAVRNKPKACLPAYLPSTSCLYIILRSSMMTKSWRSARTRHKGHTASSKAMAVSEDSPDQHDRERQTVEGLSLAQS